MPVPASMRRLWDAHTHLHLHPEPHAALAHALAAGVTDILVCATRPSDWPAVLALCATHPRALIPNLGVHPYHAGAAGPPCAWLPALEAALDAAAAPPHLRLGLGEIGLDFSPRALAANPAEVQLVALHAQLALAATRALPVSLHCVRAHGALLEALQARAAAGGLPRGLLLHSWGGRPVDAARLQALGVPCIFSFAGGLVASAARALGAAGGQRTPGCASRDTLASWAALPRAACAMETDAPDQPFQRHVTPALRAAWGGSGVLAAAGNGGGGGGGGGPSDGAGAGAAGADAVAEGTVNSAAGTAVAGDAAAVGCCAGGQGGSSCEATEEGPNAPEFVLQVAAAGALLASGASAVSQAQVVEHATSANARLEAMFPFRALSSLAPLGNHFYS